MDTTTTDTPILPADCECELRDLARDLQFNGAPFEADRLLAIVRRYSGIKPLRACEELAAPVRP